MTNQAQRSQSQPIVKWLLMLYLLFVIYGSLVPLKYVFLPLGEAILAFQNIPFLKLGVESRADWVANGVLYVPLGFLLVAALLQAVQQVPKILLLATALVLSMAVAIGVEFTQLYFPQRTVSLNDIMAECLGSLLGVMLAAKYLKWFDALLGSLLGDPQRLMLLALDGYVVAYLALSLFPYDLLLSSAELAEKFASPNLGWLVAGSSPRPMLLGFQSLAELVMTMPFGFLLARLTRGRSSLFQAAVVGLILGGIVEIAQLFIASGVSQGLSVLTRAAGVWGGLALSRHRHRWTLELISAALRRFSPALALAYVMALLEVNGWFTLHWHGFASAQLGEVNFMPFYYHYFTTEAIALFSLAAVTLSYMPFGFLAWAHGRSSSFTLVIATMAAIVVEAGKLFIEGSHPDPTNIILAGVSGALTAGLLRHLSQLKPVGVQINAKATVAPLREKKSGSTPLLLPVLAVSVAGIWLAGFPAFPLLVVLTLGVCAAMVWFRPVWAFAIIPAALPVFDLAPGAGVFFWTSSTSCCWWCS